MLGQQGEEGEEGKHLVGDNPIIDNWSRLQNLQEATACDWTQVPLSAQTVGKSIKHVGTEPQVHLLTCCLRPSARKAQLDLTLAAVENTTRVLCKYTLKQNETKKKHKRKTYLPSSRGPSPPWQVHFLLNRAHLSQSETRFRHHYPAACPAAARGGK